MKRIKLILSLLLLCAIGLTACEVTPSAFEDIEWVLESYGEKGNLQPVLEGRDVTIKFDSAEGQLSGSK